MNTALDEAGATLGPLIAAVILFLRGDYRTAYAMLTISVVLAIGALVAARLTDVPGSRAIGTGPDRHGEKLGLPYWLYMGAGALLRPACSAMRSGRFTLSGPGLFRQNGSRSCLPSPPDQGCSPTLPSAGCTTGWISWHS